jgi:CBS domain-containing protein
MSLERFRRTDLVVLTRQSKAYQAARAMADNHIGAVLVSEHKALAGIVTDRDLALAVLGGGIDPQTTSLDEVMSENVIACDIGGQLGDVVRLMQEHGVRRIPITEGGRVVGLVTFDDLVADGSVALDALRAIVIAQLEVGALQEPADSQYSEGPGRKAGGRARVLTRARARAEAIHQKLVMAVADAADLDRPSSERTLLVAICMLCRRLSRETAHQITAQFPSRLQPFFDQCLEEPDRDLSTAAIEKELGSALGLGGKGASRALEVVCKAVADSVASEEIDEICRKCGRRCGSSSPSLRDRLGIEFYCGA